MAIAAVIWLSYEFWRLLWEPGYWGAIDLRVLQNAVERWVGGTDVYTDGSSGGLYPPASYLLLWPFMGWLGRTPERWFWACTTLFALGSLIFLIVRASGAETARDRFFVTLIPLSMYATGATIGNGQLTLHVLAPLIAGVLLLPRNPHHWWDDLLPSTLILVSLVKPSISVPFFWIVLFVPGRLRPALMVGAGYLLLSLGAVSFQQSAPFTLIREWLHGSSVLVSVFGNANLSIWLGSLGLSAWIMPAALLSLMALGGWIWQRRHDDLWILLGVTAVVARLWIYHFWYDDLLLLLPMIALYRIARAEQTTEKAGVVAGVLLGMLILLMIAPGGLYLLPSPWNSVYQAFQVAVWLAVMIFLILVPPTHRAAAIGMARSINNARAV